MDNPEIDGLAKLRIANIVMIITAIFALWQLGYFFAELGLGTTNVRGLIGTTNGIIVGSSAIGQAATLMMARGFGELRSLDPRFKIGRTGSIVAFVSFLISSIFLNPLFMGLSYLLIFIGYILLGIGYYRIGKAYSSDVLKVGAILLILIPVIGLILNVIGLHSIIGRVKRAAEARPPWNQ